ncbi:MAG TPA: tetratricopeptide repeat protein [Drouetiella sp.]|jgi:tetratricopeptide (TPR) repeat protein
MTTELFRSSDFNRDSASTTATFDFANVMSGAPQLRKLEGSGNGLNGQDKLDFSDRSLFLCADDKSAKPKDPNEDIHAKAGYKAFLEGKYGDAETAYKSLLDVSQKSYGKDSKEVAFAYALLGETCEKDKRYEDARAYYKKGVEVSSKASGKDHIETGMLWHNVAQMDHQLKNWKDAAAAYKSAVDILAAEKNGPSSENARMNESTKALKGYADVLNQQGDKKGADEQLKRAKEIEKNYLTQPQKGIIYY